MHRPMTTDDNIAAAQVAIWSLYLLSAIYLCLRHGFGRSSGWLFLVFLSLTRLIGSSLRLATLSSPTNVSLYVGWAVCNGLGAGWLIAVGLGLLGRLVDSIRRTRDATGRGSFSLTPLHQRVVSLFSLLAIILVAVGGSQAKGRQTADGGLELSYPKLSVIGLALFVVVLVISILEALYLSTKRDMIPNGEKRILLAFFLALPFSTARLAYACCLVWGGYSPSSWFTLGLEVIMEMVGALIFIVMGLTLSKAVKDVPADVEMQDKPYGNSRVEYGVEPRR